MINEGTAMKNILTNLRSPALISSILVLPFMILEVLNRRQFNEGFPIILFVLMWLLPMGFILILIHIVRKVRAGTSLMATPVPLLLSITFLILIAVVWTGALIDQMSCFLGVPNCD